MTTCAAHVRHFRRDCRLFFSLLPSDVVALLCELTFRTSPKAGDPRQLALASTLDTMPHARFASFCVDRHNNIVVADTQHNRVFVFWSESGDIIREVGSTLSHRWPSACVVDRAGNFYVSEAGNHCISVFRPDGRYVRDIGYNPGTLSPAGLDLSRDESLVYAASHGQDGIVACSVASGASLYVIGKNRDRMYDEVVVRSCGELVCGWSSAGRGGICIFASNGAHIGDISSSSIALNRPVHMATDSDDNIYVVQNRSPLLVFMPSTQQCKIVPGDFGGGVALRHGGGGVLLCDMAPYAYHQFKIYR